MIQKDEYITADIWEKAKSMATLQKKKIGQWIAEAIMEKFSREINMEARKYEKGT
jgi:hypothetical protein